MVSMLPNWIAGHALFIQLAIWAFPGKNDLNLVVFEADWPLSSRKKHLVQALPSICQKLMYMLKLHNYLLKLEFELWNFKDKLIRDC